MEFYIYTARNHSFSLNIVLVPYSNLRKKIVLLYTHTGSKQQTERKIEWASIARMYYMNI